MELKRYVLFENGVVHDNEKRKLRFTVMDGLNYFVWEDESRIACLAYNYATADDIFELVKEGWLVDYHGKMRFVFKNEKNINGKSDNLWLEETGESEYITSSWYANIHTLFAPITEKGKIVRYELVWQRESK